MVNKEFLIQEILALPDSVPGALVPILYNTLYGDSESPDQVVLRVRNFFDWDNDELRYFCKATVTELKDWVTFERSITR